MKVEETRENSIDSVAGTGEVHWWRQATLQLEDSPRGYRESVGDYVQLMMDYNRHVNVISRKTEPDTLALLLKETELLFDYINPAADIIIDAGSGNGILGVPIAFKAQGKTVVLIEPRKKKSQFLFKVKNDLGVDNLEVYDVSIEEYLKQKKTKGKYKTLISRGFPNNDALLNFVRNKSVNEAVLITSENKLKKSENQLDSCIQKTYNLPLRDHLLILKFSREKR